MASRNRLREIRLARGLNGQKAADLAGMFKQVWSNIETGKSSGSLATWRRIQKVLQIPDAEMWSVMSEGHCDD